MHFTDPAVAEPLARFQERLAQARAAVVAANQKRQTPYEFLLTENIPQSINI